MTDLQREAFNNVNSWGFTVEQSYMLFGGLALAVVLIWFAWVTISTYRQFCAGRVRVIDMSGPILRSFFIMLVVLFLVGT